MNTARPLPAAVREATERRFGRAVAAALDRSLAEPPAGIAERLRFARETALERARASGRAAELLVAVGRPSAGGAAALGFARSAWWGRFATVLPLVALVAGLVLIADRQQSEQIDTAARIDAELLGDDLPIGAYRDPGFVEFLKAPPAE